MAVMFVFTHLFHVETSELRLGATDSHVVFAQVRQSTGEGEYLVIVSPEGWQRTGIVVHAGQKVSFSAGGKICIDLNEIWEMVQKRKRYEEEIVQAKGIRANEPAETRTPEDYFTPEQKQSLILHAPGLVLRGSA